MVLADLKPGESGIIQSIKAEDLLLRRLLHLGFVPGTLIQVCFSSRRRDPIAYRVRGTVLALRRSTADKIIIRYLGGSALCPHET